MTRLGWGAGVVAKLLGMGLAGSVAACALEGQPPGALPVSSSPGGSQGVPQAPGSLPPGAVVNEPLTPGLGDY